MPGADDDEGLKVVLSAQQLAAVLSGQSINLRYENLYQLIGGRFHEDFDLFGNTIEELVLSFTCECTPEEINATVAEIDRFKSDHAGNLDAAFEENFGYQCDPTVWEQTTEAFLDKLKRLLLSE
ncbi:contact-dependent growth inhibition system immunity protein [Paraburkholderia sp. 31.1]|uniref:contact-dependent growth inhibition system immunity protein n=1 Tax=Paraburkholderia sp. 31.1 TaxID=2615205 RepID=UPI00223B17F6|nr:contact-dependent growth inhibition system immunity protein [Paraburkholderia sp. 31.1]